MLLATILATFVIDITSNFDKKIQNINNEIAVLRRNTNGKIEMELFNMVQNEFETGKITTLEKVSHFNGILFRNCENGFFKTRANLYAKQGVGLPLGQRGKMSRYERLIFYFLILICFYFAMFN